MQLAHEGVVTAQLRHPGVYPLHLLEILHQSRVLLLGPVVPDTEGLCLPGLLTAVAGLGVTGVYGEGAVGVPRLFTGQYGQSPFPVGQGIVVLDVPGIVGHSVESQPGSLGVLHRVAQQTAEILGTQTVVQTIGRSLHHDIAAVIGHGEVPPYQRRTLYPIPHPLEGRGGHVAAHSVTCPEYADRGIELAAVDSQAAAVRGIGPGAVVVGRADDQRGHVPLDGHELSRQPVEQLHLPHRVGALSGYVVEEDGECPDSQVIHCLELGHQTAVVLLVPLNILTGMHGPDEVHPVALTGAYQFRYLPGLSGRIGVAPVGRAVIRVVLGPVDIGVHLVAAEEVNQGQTGLVGPGCAVEPLDHSAGGQVRPVIDAEAGQLSVRILLH